MRRSGVLEMALNGVERMISNMYCSIVQSDCLFPVETSDGLAGASGKKSEDQLALYSQHDIPVILMSVRATIS